MTTEVFQFDLGPSDPIYIAGMNGMVGQAIWREFALRGFRNIHGHSHAALDLRNSEATFRALEELKPRLIVLAAAKVGGIGANNSYPYEFLVDNLRIQMSVLEAAKSLGTPRLLFLGSSCVYPKHAAQPIKESYLLSGPLEGTNEAYAIAKIAGLIEVQALRREYGLPYVSMMPCNLYGVGDNYDLESSHVLPALIRKFHDAVSDDAPTVHLWGSGAPLREFLHVEDLARACFKVVMNYDHDEPINVGSGHEISISDLATLVAHETGFRGEIVWDGSKPDGTPRKVLDSSKMRNLGWEPQIGLQDGIARTVIDFRSLY